MNPTSGAGGYYQIMPSTWAAYGGTGAPQNAPMSEQTAIAQKIYDSVGPKRLDQLLSNLGWGRERSHPTLAIARFVDENRSTSFANDWRLRCRSI